MISALAGLIGVIVGVLLTNILTGRSQRKQWIADNKKQEYRELMSTLTKSVTVIMAYRGGRVDLHLSTVHEAYQEAYDDALRVLNDRIFIADEIQRDKMYDRWTEAMAEVVKTNDIDRLSDRFEEIKSLILKSAARIYR